MVNETVQKVIKQLQKANLSIEDRTALTTVMLGRLLTIPIGDMVIFTQSGVMINGKELDSEQLIAFKEACTSLKKNYARRVISEQVRYKAIEMGIHKSTSDSELFFSKAAIWVLNEENILLEKLIA